jgi:hypothetical protein
MEWIPAAITGGLALVTAIFVNLYTNRNRMAEQKSAEDARTRLALLEDRLKSQSAAEQAQQDYEYEARKRLYTVARPLLFQLGDLCETSNRRIERILTNNITPPARPDSTKLVVTTYRLIAPLVLARLLQQRLTTVDLGLDADLRNQYLLAKDLLSVFANGHELASYRPADYAAGQHGQELTTRHLDRTIEALTKRDGARNIVGVKSAVEFENECLDQSLPTAGQCTEIFDLFQKAAPSSPVLWRILATHHLLQSELLGLLAAQGYPQVRPMFGPPAGEPYRSAYLEAHACAAEYVATRQQGRL